MSARGDAGTWRYWAYWDEETGQVDIGRSSGGDGIIPGMPRNDREYAVLMLARMGARAHWTSRKGGGTWRVWDGTHHREDDSLQADRDLVNVAAAELQWCAHELREAIRTEAMTEPEAQRENTLKRLMGQADGVLKFAARLMTGTGHAAVMGVLKTYMGVPDSAFTDRWPEHLNTPAGIHDLRSGRIWPHDPRAMISYVTPYAPDFRADCPLFRRLVRHLATTENGYSAGIEAFILRVLGYALLGDNREQRWVWFLGQTASGKSVLQELMRQVLGTLAAEGDKNLVLVSRDKPHARSENNLRGRRVVFFAEWGDYDHADENKYKQLTGESRLTLNELYSVLPHDSRTAFLPVTFTNDMPTIGDADSAVARRTLVCPAGLTMPEDARVSGLADVIARAEGGAVLALLMRECFSYLREGLVIPHEVTMATDLYLGMQKREALFIDEYCARKAEGYADARQLWDLWTRWSESRSVRLSRQKFYKRIEALPGIMRESNGGSVNRFRGIEILPQFAIPYF